MSRFIAYVHLAYGFDSRKWQAKWRAGKVLGLNEEFPYGYHHAAEFGATVVYSTDHPETAIGKLLRYGARGLFGFDFVHAWRNRREIWQADVVWTHTESQSLAILLLFALSRRATRPKLIAQFVWLMDAWPRAGLLRRAIYKSLLRKADILTFHSPLNAQAAAALFPDKRVEVLKFGINTVPPTLPSHTFEGRKTRLLSAGNDRHRDWSTLIEAVNGADDIELRLLTTAYKLPRPYPNITALRVDSNDALLAQFAWADIVVVPLKPNLHASGLTVVEEAATLGVPVVCTNVGGMDYYFGNDAVLYVDPYAPERMLDAVRRLAGDAGLRQTMVAAARRRLVEGGISSRDYARRHVELSLELLGLSAET